MSSESTSPDDHDHVDVTVSPPQPSPPGDVSSQEIGGSTNASGSTTTATTPSPLQQEAPRNGTTASTIRAINDDDPPIPVWQVADHEKETNGPQLHDGPPGPPRFPQELDDSLAKKVEKERAAFPAPEDRLRHEDIGSGERTAQETGGGTKVGDMTAAPMVQEEVIQGGMLESMIHAISDDDPPIPVLQVANHEKSEGNQAERVANEFEHDSSDHPRDNAPTVHSTMGASDANAAEADPPMVGTNTSTNTKSPGAAGSEATNSGTKANAGIVTIILPQATMVTPGDDDDPEPTIVASIVLPFYRRKGFLYVMVAMILLAVGIAVAVPLSSNVLSSNLAPQPWTYQAKLLATDGEARDYFGWSVSIYRDTVVVGAPCENYRIGSVHVFVRSEKEWTHQAKLLAPDGAVDDYFGFSSAIYGNSVVVGAPYDNDKGFDSGSAHVFVRSGEEWTHQAKLLAPGGAVRDYFGWSVAIHRDTIVVGSYRDDDNGNESGSAHVFVRSGEEWTHQAKLLAPDGTYYDWFGRSVAIYGDTVVVGAPFDDDNGDNSGSAHVFVRSGEEWTHQAKLLAPDGAAFDWFGESVAIYGDSIVVGAYGDDDNGYHSGSAHVFVQSGEEWNYQAKLLAPDGAAYDNFGDSVAIYGDTIVVDARDDDNGSNRELAHVFVRSREEWTHQAKLLAPDGRADDEFGENAAIYGDSVVVGTDWDGDNGSAYVFVVV